MRELTDIWTNYSESFYGIGKNIIISLIITVTGVLLFKGINKLIKKTSAGKFRIDDNISTILSHSVRYGILIICATMILNIFGFNTSSIIAVMGAAGVAVGLALKDTLGNIAAGIILIFLGSYHRGEFIEFDSFNGTVKEISLFTTILETPEGIYISAPNSSIWGSPLKNYSRNGKRRMELSVRISYSDPLDTAFQVLRDIAASEEKFLKEPAPQVILQSLQDSSVNMVIRAWVANQYYWDVYWQQMRTLKEKVEDAGLHIPFQQRDVHIVAQRQQLPAGQSPLS